MKKLALLSLLISGPILSMEPVTNSSKEQYHSSSKNFPLNDNLFKNKNFIDITLDVLYGNLKNIKHFFENYPDLIYTVDETGNGLLCFATYSLIDEVNDQAEDVFEYIINREHFQVRDNVMQYLKKADVDTTLNDRKKKVLERIETAVKRVKATALELLQNSTTKESKDYFTGSNIVIAIGAITVGGLVVYYLLTNNQTSNR